MEVAQVIQQEVKRPMTQCLWVPTLSSDEEDDEALVNQKDALGNETKCALWEVDSINTAFI